MSVKPLCCSKCQVAGSFDRVVPFPGRGDETGYGVSWRCPRCSSRALDVCPLGPLVPTEESCLNCGAEGDPLDDEHPCPQCGLTPTTAAACLELTPRPIPWPTARGLCDRGLFRRGLAELNRLLLTQPGLVEAYQVKVQFLIALRFFRSIVTLIERVYPDSVPPVLLFEWARSLQAVGRHADTVTAYRQFLATNPEASVLEAVHCNLANSLQAIGEVSQAEDHYREALKINGDGLLVRFNYAVFLMSRQRSRDALEIIDALVRPDSTDPLILTLWEDKAYLHCELEEGEAALAAADTALQLEPQRSRATYLRGRALALLGRLEQAREVMRSLLAREPEHADAQRALARIDEALTPKKPASSKPWWQFWR